MPLLPVTPPPCLAIAYTDLDGAALPSGSIHNWIMSGWTRCFLVSAWFASFSETQHVVRQGCWSMKSFPAFVLFRPPFLTFRKAALVRSASHLSLSTPSTLHGPSLRLRSTSSASARSRFVACSSAMHSNGVECKGTRALSTSPFRTRSRLGVERDAPLEESTYCRDEGYEKVQPNKLVQAFVELHKSRFTYACVFGNGCGARKTTQGR